MIEQIKKIAAINKFNSLDSKNEQEFEEYIEKLNEFCDIFPDYKDKIQKAMDDNSIDDSVFEKLNNCLLSINAADIADTVKTKILKRSEFTTAEKLTPDLTEILRSLDVLSIDIQVALHHKPKDEDESSEGQEKSEYSILAVDDTALFLRLIKQYLDKTEYKVVCVNTGTAAIRYLTNNKPDLFLLDIDMPGMNGYELAQKIRNQDLNQPIVFLTAQSNRGSVVKAIQAGGTDFIIKPCTREQLLERIKKNLKT